MRVMRLVLLVLAASPVYAEVQVRVAGDRVSLHAVSTPVSEILDSLARQTGMRLTCDAPCPRQSLTATLENRTPTEAILSLLEGLGLNYALVMDRAGTRVEQLLILGTAVGGAARASAPAPVERLTPPEPAGRILSAAEQEAMWGDQPTEADSQDDESEGDETEGHADQQAGKPSASGAAPHPGPPGPRPPEYPSSAFTPRLPMPTPPPTPEPPKNQ